MKKKQTREHRFDRRLARRIGMAFAQARKDRGWTQARIARHAGTYNQTVSMLERGKLGPSLSLLRRVLRPLKMPLGMFFSAAGL